MNSPVPLRADAKRTAPLAVTALLAAASLLGACSTSDAPASPSAVTSAASASTSAAKAGTTSEQAQAEAHLESAATSAAPEPVPVEKRREVAASLLMPSAVNYDDALAKLKAGVAGIFLPSWADPALLTEPGRDIWALRQVVGRDFEVAIDFEGGRVQRFSHIIGTFPAPRDMGASAEDIGFQIGQALAARGITVDFAPVMDVDGGNLDVVGDRAFAADPANAGAQGAAFARGLSRAGITPVLKHYPGHGRATGDSHLGAVYTPPLRELFGWEFIPFSAGFAQVPQANVMVGHMVVPGLGPEGVPASLNSHAYGLLRTTHKFEGLAYTDDLTGMRAITDHYSAQEAAVAAIAAGADRALWSSAVDITSVIDAVEAAVRDGVISEQRFAEAAARG